MTKSFTRKQLSLAVSCAVALGLASGTASAQTNPADTGYLTDRREAVVKSDFALCWHTGAGPAPASTLECDPNFVPPPLARLDAPAPQPAPVAALAPQPVAERVTLDTDTLFDFDKAVLRPAGHTALDDFVAKIQGIKTEMILAAGHADRFGSEAYNQRLSEQRVAAVKTYLVSKGIEPNRVQTEGKGEMQPITKSGDCDGAKSAKVIACLQPDRRVEVEVIGTRMAN